MSTIDSFLQQYENIYPKIKSQQNHIVIYLKLEEYFLIEDFYDAKTLFSIQKKVKNFLKSKLTKINPLFSNIYQLNDGEYVIAIKKELLEKNINQLVSSLKNFQKNIKDKILTIDSIHFQTSLLISMAYKGENTLESAKLGIKELLKKNKEFIISNDFAKKAKEKTKKNLQIISIIKYAIHNSKVKTYFQPIIDNKTNKTLKYESLIRIFDHDNNLLEPHEFLEVAKKGKYYYQLTRIVLQKSFRFVIKHNKEVSINLSMRDIESNLIRKIIYDLLKKYKDYASKITFELLEDEEIKDIETISYFITQVKSQGVKIAIDDFGKGFSNFERLLYYKPDILKIDGLLIKDIDKNSYSYSMVKTIVDFAKEQKIVTIAEFVENEEIYRCVKKLGVDFSQGYYINKPCSEKEL